LYDVVLGTIPLFQLLDLETELKVYPSLASPDRESIPRSLNQIDIQNLSFGYPDQSSQILKNINLTIQQNEVIALVGNNAAGKTTLIKLLCRLYDPTEGAILWNQKDIKTIELESYRQRITTVLQDYAQFPASLRENIAFGNLDLYGQDEKIWNVLEKVNLASSFRYRNDALETPLGRELENGIELSGGQWQRLAIARSLIRLSQAKLFILDEPTATLDANIEENIYDLFEEIAHQKMTIFISHRLALCQLADRIIVMDQGQIVEIGNHQELILEKGQYYQMFRKQASRYF
jgi:ATP-binding cassette subfamily B protein